MEIDNTKPLTTEETNGCTTVDGEESNIIFCMHCGAAVKKGSAYCSNCGQVIPEVKPHETIQDELIPKKKGIKKWPFFVFGPFSIVITIVILIIVLFGGSLSRDFSSDSKYGSHDSIYDFYLVGRWTGVYCYEDDEIDKLYSISAYFYDDHTGRIWVGDESWDIEWKYDSTADENVFYRVYLGDADILSGIDRNGRGDLYLSLSESMWVFEKD